MIQRVGIVAAVCVCLGAAAEPSHGSGFQFEFAGVTVDFGAHPPPRFADVGVRSGYAIDLLRTWLRRKAERPLSPRASPRHTLPHVAKASERPLTTPPEREVDDRSPERIDAEGSSWSETSKAC